MISLSGLSPSYNEKQVSLETSIEFTIVDDGSGIDISSLIVVVNGFRAIENLLFHDDFDGAASAITPSGNDYNIVIDPINNFNKGQTVAISIQVKTTAGDYLNESHVFKTILDEPVLSLSSPVDNGLVTQVQIYYLEFEDQLDSIDTDSIDIEINGLSYIDGGVLNTSENGPNSQITTQGDSVIVRIDPIEPLRDGDYILKYSIADVGGAIGVGRIRFTVEYATIVLPDTSPQTGFLGFFQGIKRVSDCGTGDQLKVEWNTPLKRAYLADTYVLVYKNTSRLDIFDSDPDFIMSSDVEEYYLTGLTTGETLSFAARAMETYKDAIDTTGMSELTTGVFSFPNSTTISRQILDTDTKIYVDSVDGYPQSGYLIIGTEVIRYTSVSVADNAFLVPTNGRALLGSSAGIYIIGDEVKFFTNCRDDNTVIIMATPTFQDGYEIDREIAGEGLVVTDYSDNDQKFFQGFDFCGYHRTMPQESLAGQDDCGSYLGGDFNGWRGFDIFDRLLSREEVLLDQVGEPTVLLRRIWTGQICSCMNMRRSHPKLKGCKECFGTGYVGGYTKYNNRRREDARVMVSFAEAAEDLKLGSYEHLQQEYEPSAWTIPIPAVRDRDLLVRFDFTGDIEFIYEVLDTSKEKIIFKHYTRQRLRLKRMDKTDICYSFDLQL